MQTEKQQAAKDAKALGAALANANTCNGGADCTCEPGNYYVSAVDGPSLHLMAGPYPTHKAAQADRDKALRIADDIDGRAWFMGWGVVSWANGDKPGVLNKHGLI